MLASNEPMLPSLPTVLHSQRAAALPVRRIASTGPVLHSNPREPRQLTLDLRPRQA